MMKKLIAVLISCFIFSSFNIQAQENSFVSHEVKAGETLSAIAKEYYTTVGDIMRLNGWHADSKLEVGNTIKIPGTLSKNNTIETESGKNETSIIRVESPLTPINYTVIKGDNLFQISQKFNVSLDELKAWNNLPDGSVKVGQVLIVGNNSAAVSATPTKVETEQMPQVSTDNSLQTLSAPPPENVNVQNSASAHKSDFFSNAYDKISLGKSEKQISGTAMTFRSVSGWVDKKYYILSSQISPGSVVKLSSASGNKVYAKVLWNMQNFEQKNVDFLISNAAAAALGINHPSFNLTVSYINN